MAIPAILSALRGASGGAASLAGGGPGKPPPLPGQSGRGFFEAAKNMEGLAGKAQQLTGALGQVAGPFKAFVGGIVGLPAKFLHAAHEVTHAGQQLVAGLAAPITGIKQLGDSLAVFTRLSNPAQFRRFQYTIENTFATLGTILEQPMEALIRAGRGVGDTFAKLRPALAPLMDAGTQLIDWFTQDVLPAVVAAAPLIQSFSYAMLGLVKVTRFAVAPLLKFVEVVGQIAQMVGLDKLLGGGAADPDAKSGVAVREPRYLSNQEISREMAQNALMASAGPKKMDAAQATTTLLTEFQAFVTAVTQWFGPGWPLKLAAALAANQGPGEIAGQAAKVLPGGQAIGPALERIANWLTRQGML